MRAPAEIVADLERDVALSAGPGDRFSGSGVDDVREGPIDIAWHGPRRFTVRADDGELDWEVEVGSTLVTRAFNGLARSWWGRRGSPARPPDGAS